MESTVAQVSRYLDRGDVVLFSRAINGLLVLAFQRTLHRHVAKLRRLETLAEMEEKCPRPIDPSPTRQAHALPKPGQILLIFSDQAGPTSALSNSHDSVHHP